MSSKQDITTIIQEAAEHATGVYYEKIKDDFIMILEAVTDMQQKVANLDKVQTNLTELKTDMGVIKQVLKDTNRDIQNHKRRIIKLETTHA